MGHKGKYTAANLLARRTRPFNPQEARDTFDLLDKCVGALQDKRPSTREKALTALAGALEDLPRLDEVDSRCFNIFALCGVCIKEGGPKEARLAFRAVGLLALTLRAGAPGILTESFPLLNRTLQQYQDKGDAATLVAALDCLAAVTFAGAQGKADVERSIKAVWNLIFPSFSKSSKTSGGEGATKTDPEVLVAAVSTWAFLVSTVVSVTHPQRKADGDVWSATATSLTGLLDHEHRAVRMAAGEALAVCVELNLTQHAPRKDMDALAAKASELATEAAGRYADNAMLPEQRDLFRQMLAFLDRDERPDLSVRTSQKGCVALKVSTWTKLVQLNFLRRFLGRGFVKHGEENELFVEAFSYGADEGNVLSIAKKKQGSEKEKGLKVKRTTRFDWAICCDYPYTLAYKPDSLLHISWQALN